MSKKRNGKPQKAQISANRPNLVHAHEAGSGPRQLPEGPIGSLNAEHQENSEMIRDENLIDVYTCYVEKISNQSHIGLNQFKIYFGFNAGLIALGGFVAKPALDAYFGNPQAFTLPALLRPGLILLAVVGLVFSIAWFLVMHDSRRWTLVFNKTLALMEKRLFRHSNEGFYTRINAEYPPDTWFFGIDLTDLNRALPLFFVFVWLMVLLGALGNSYVISAIRWVSSA